MENIDYMFTEINDGFWEDKIDLVRKVTVKAVYDRFKETGRIGAVCFDKYEIEKNSPHPYYDSDVAK